MARSILWKDSTSQELARELVEIVTWCPKSSENFTTLVQYVLSNFRYHQFLDVNSKNVERTVDGICQKFKIHSQSEKAESLQNLRERFLNSVLSSASRETKTDAHYSLLSLLLALSDSPTHTDYIPQSKEQEQAKEEEFDWVAYLLEGEEKEVLGLPVQQNQAGWSDDEDEEQDQSTDSGILLSNCSQDPQWLKPVDNETVFTELADSKKDTTWLSDHVVNQYWCQETPLHVSHTAGTRHCSLAAYWENFRRDEDPFGHSITMTTLTETQVVRETIWLLFGVKTSYVYTQSSGAINIGIRDNIQVSHLTPESLKSLLLKFAAAGEHVVALQNFKSDVFDPENSLSYTLTLKAFASALSCYFQKYKEHLRSIEKSIIKQETAVTLLGLQDKLKTELNEVRTLYDLYQYAVLETKELTNSQKTTFLLNAVYSSLIQADELGPSTKWKLCLLLQIFLETIRPCLDFVNEWVMSGEVQDPFNEFFILRTSEVSVDSASFWSEGVVLRSSSHPAAVPFFLQNLVEKIVRAGKSTELILGLGKIDRLESLITKEPLYEDFLNQLLKSLSIIMPEKMENYAEEKSILEEITRFHQICSAIEDTGDHVLKLSFINLFPVEPSAFRSSESYIVEKLKRICSGDWDILKPVKLMIADCLTPLVEERCAQANCALISLMKSEYNILDHLAALKNFFLLEAGDVMHQFYSEIFVKARRREVWQDIYSLNCFMEDALLPRFPECVRRLVVSLTEGPNAGGKRSSQALNGLVLHYKAPWPVNIVIDSSSQKLYNHVFLFLMKLKQCKWSLDELRFSDLIGNRKQVSSDDQGVVKPAAGSERELLQKMFLFRFQLMHFVNSIHYYFMTRILHTTGVEFQEAIDQVESLDDLITAHSSYVEKLHDRCLLSQKAGSLREVVLKVFNLVLQFQTQWDNGVQHCSHENFKTITETFSKCNTFLVSCLKTISKRGAFPHLESLAFALS